MSGWVLFGFLFLIALIFWASVWKIITWVCDKVADMYTTKMKGRK